jgi:hypothetical protein
VQQVPQRRVGALRGAMLSEMSEWGQKHPSIPKVSAGTVNKQLGALQAIAAWAEQNGLIPEDTAWSNPLPRDTPRALAAARACRVRVEISARSFSASAAKRCRTNGSTSGPSSVTRNGTLCAISPLMKCTSRLNRSNFATAT